MNLIIAVYTWKIPVLSSSILGTVLQSQERLNVKKLMLCVINKEVIKWIYNQCTHQENILVALHINITLGSRGVFSFAKRRGERNELSSPQKK